MDAPRLLIIAEHDACSHTQKWLSLCIELAQHLPLFPHAVLQVRAKTKPHLRQQLLNLLSSHTQISVNCSAEESTLFSSYLLHHPQQQAPQSLVSYSFGMSIHEAHDAAYFDQYSPLYYQLGPIFTPLSKQGISRGIELIQHTKTQTQTPLIAVGGIIPSHIPELIMAGAYGIASSGYILQANTPVHALNELYSTIRKYI